MLRIHEISLITTLLALLLLIDKTPLIFSLLPNMKQLYLQIFVLITLSSSTPTRARTYPKYCSTREEQLKRRIPKLKTDTPLISQIANLSLEHVTTIIRHGSRTPWAPHQCWAGYTDPQSDTSLWECKLTTIMRPQTEMAFDIESIISGDSYESTTESGHGLFFEFEKMYDANFSKDNPSHFPSNMANDLRGDCQKGQLILKGHDQQIINGQILKQAYVQNDATGFITPDVGVLFDYNVEKDNTNVNQRAYDEPQLYFRSDDDQRTMLSGQILLRSMFHELMVKHEEHYQSEGKEQDRPIIRVHTADRDHDILSPNPIICPRLTELENEARSSSDYKQQFLNSDTALLMKKLVEDEFGGGERMQDGGEAIDCVMTTVCEDKTLPYVLDVDQSGDDQNVIDKYGIDIFDRFVNFNVMKEAFVLTYKNSVYSKISTNPLWNDILAGLLVHTNANKYELHKAWPDLRPKSKFALYSAHDTTIMTLLASLGGSAYDSSSSNAWPPYASMLNIELFGISWKSDVTDDIRNNFPTNIGFRLLYNGEPITHHITGCMRQEEICDIDLLVLHVYPFSNVTEWDETCKKVKNDAGNNDNGNHNGNNNESSNNHLGSSSSRRYDGQNIVLLFMGGLLCAICGAFVTFFYLSKQQVRFKKIPYSLPEETSSTTQSIENGKIYGLPSEQRERESEIVII